MRRLALLVIVAAGCRTQQLPPEPPGADPTDPRAPAPAAPVSHAVDRSAFEGVKLKAGGHHHPMKKGGK